MSAIPNLAWNIPMEKMRPLSGAGSTDPSQNAVLAAEAGSPEVMPFLEAATALGNVNRVMSIQSDAIRTRHHPGPLPGETGGNEESTRTRSLLGPEALAMLEAAQNDPAVQAEREAIRNEERAIVDEDWLTLRALYNVKSRNGDTEGLDKIFQDFQPERSRLSGEDRERYDQVLAQIMQSLDTKGFEIDKAITDRQLFELDGTERPMDPSMKFIIAASIAEAWHNQPGVVDQIVSDPRWRVVVGTPEDPRSHRFGGLGGNGQIDLAVRSAQAGLANPTDGSNIVAHEFNHVADQLDDRRFNNTLPDLSPDQQQTLAREVQRFMNDERLQNLAVREGISSYAFEPEMIHITVVMAETFFEQPEKVARVSPRLYNLFREYFGRTDLPEIPFSNIDQDEAVSIFNGAESFEGAEIERPVLPLPFGQPVETTTVTIPPSVQDGELNWDELKNYQESLARSAERDNPEVQALLDRILHIERNFSLIASLTGNTDSISLEDIQRFQELGGFSAEGFQPARLVVTPDNFGNVLRSVVPQL